MTKINYSPIGLIHSPHKTSKGTPIQAKAARGIKGRIELNSDYAEGLKDLDGFSHIILIYHFHRIKECRLLVKPFMDDAEHGIFAIRGPARPNPIGISVVRLDKIEENTLYINDVDILDGTPLLDIKPYVPAFDHVENASSGWLEESSADLDTIKDDGRFLS